MLLLYGNYIGTTTALVTWHPFRQHNFRTNHFQTIFLIWIFISVKLSFQRYQIPPYLDTLFIFLHYDVIPEMTSLPGWYKKAPGGSLYSIPFWIRFRREKLHYNKCPIVTRYFLPNSKIQSFSWLDLNLVHLPPVVTLRKADHISKHISIFTS